MVKFGTVKSTTPLDDDGSTLSTIPVYHEGKVIKTYKQYEIRVRVTNPQEETAEYLRWSDELRAKQQAGTLVTDKEKYYPVFTLEYPRTQGAYFVIRGWTELTPK